jgi:hypothetical protein
MSSLAVPVFAFASGLLIGLLLNKAKKQSNTNTREIKIVEAETPQELVKNAKESSKKGKGEYKMVLGPEVFFSDVFSF